MAMLPAAPGQHPSLPGTTLTRVAQVRSLAVDQAGRSVPVHLTGVVTVPSTYKTSFFFMDSTGGVSVDRADGGDAMEAGQRVEIEGVTAPGLFAPIILSQHIRLLGKGPLPPAREVIPEGLRGGKQDSQWISVRGQVRTAAIQSVWGHPVLVLKADLGSSQFVSVQVRDFSKKGWERLPGAVVKIRGVCGTAFNDRRQFVGLRLFAASLDDVAIVRPAVADPFDMPSRPLGQLLQFDDPMKLSDPVKMTGAVTAFLRGQNLFVQDGARGVFVRSSQQTPLTIGSKVEVVGYPAAGEYAPILEDAVYRVLPGGDPISAVHISASQAIVQNEQGFWTAPFDALMVQLDGTVLVQAQDEIRDQVFLRDGNVVFRAKLPQGAVSLPELEPGTRVRVNGICGARIDEELNIHTFSLLLRSPADVVVLQRVPWWHRKSAGWTVAVVLAFLIVTGAILTLLKHQTYLRTLAMRDSLTGAYNRRGFLRLAEKAWRNASRNASSALLLYVDVDRFKEINDRYGHDTGDDALRCLVEALQLSFRNEDVIGRIGGDEFAVFCACAEGQLGHIQSRLENRLTDLRQKRGLKFAIDLSIGPLVCNPSMASLTIEDLIALADSVMYGVKAERKRAAQGPADRAESHEDWAVVETGK